MGEKEFIPIVNERRGRASKKHEVALGLNVMNVNVSLGTELDKKGYKFAQFMYSKGRLMIRFSADEESGSRPIRHVSTSLKSKQISFTSVARFLAEETTLVDFDNYKYRYDVKHIEKGIYYIELSNPLVKKKR